VCGWCDERRQNHALFILFDPKVIYKKNTKKYQKLQKFHKKSVYSPTFWRFGSDFF
jgi:hypothetical protein